MILPSGSDHMTRCLC